MKQTLTLLLLLLLGIGLQAQVSYNANQQVTPYTGKFRFGMNNGYYPNWDNQKLANIAAGNPAINQKGVGAKTLRQGLYEIVLDYYGYGLNTPDFTHYNSLGMGEYVAIIGGPTGAHQDYAQHCPGVFSSMFANLYTPTWDGGANGTPYNDNNYLAAYMYKLVSQYKDQVRFWEIWNEPGLDLTFNLGWRDNTYPGNWWAEGPNPCDNVLHAPIYQYIRTLRICYDIIKTLDPDSYVCLGSVGYQSFMNALLSNTDNPNNGDVSPAYPLGGGAYFDCVSYHSYPHFDGSTTNYDAGFFERHSDEAADGVNKYRDYYQQILSLYGYDGITYPKKEWIITETNSPRKAFSGTYFAGVDQQINHMMKAYMIAKVSKIHQVHAFQLADQKTDAEANYEFHLMGMYKKFEGNLPYNVTVNDEGKAMKTMTDLVFNTEYDAAKTAAMNLPAAARGYAFKKPDGTYIYAIWARTTEDLSEAAFATYSFPASFDMANVTRYSWDYGYTGVGANMLGTNIQLNAKPVFFVKAGSAGNCAIQVAVSNVQCSDNGTPTITTDDTFTATITVSGANTSGTWKTTIAGQTITGTVGTPKQVGPYPISGGNIAILVTDNVNTACAAEATLTAPAPCSTGGGGGGGGTYCDSKGDFPWHEWIAGVQVGTINNPSSKNQYTSFTSLSTNMTGGSTYPITLTTGYSYYTFNEYWRVWIDYNKNGVFETSEKAFEGVLTAPAAGTLTKSLNGSIVVPSTVTAGTTRMRISMKRDAYADPCGVFPNGEVEDYSVVLSTGGGGGGGSCSISAAASSVSCSDAGTATITTDDTYSYTLTVTGTNAGSGWSAVIAGQTVTGQYGVPKNLGPYSIAAGNQTYTVKDNATATCTSNVSVTAPAPCSTGGGGGGGSVPYCQSKGDFPWHEWISGVKLANLNNTSGKSGYSDFTTQTVNLVKGTATAFTGTCSFSYETANEYWKVWIDYNKNGVFEEPSELAFSTTMTAPAPGTPSKTVTGNITVPATAQGGNTRMRISMKNGSAPTACETIPFGEVEDYTVNITPLIVSNMVAPDGQTPDQAIHDVFFFEAAKSAGAVKLDWSDFNDAEVSRFEVQKSADGVAFSTIAERSSQSSLAVAQSYQHFDYSPVDGYNYYRIVTHRTDGTTRTTPAKRLLIAIPLDFEVFPNPAQDRATLDLSGYLGTDVQVTVYDARGNKTLETTYVALTEPLVVLSLDKVPSGQYYINVVATGKRPSGKKLLVEKL